jgi:hypothetical protein
MRVNSGERLGDFIILFAHGNAIMLQGHSLGVCVVGVMYVI